jgi:protein-tyrosine-phosphatase
MIKIVFICTTNGARSQLAEGLARDILGDLALVRSAGFRPSISLSRVLIDVMNEDKIDIKGQYAKSIEEINIEKATLIVHLSSQPTILPLASIKKQINWIYKDPFKINSSAERMSALRNLREDLKVKMNLLKGQVMKKAFS